MNPANSTQIADSLHSLAIHVLRRVRVRDSVSGLTPRRLSALSVIVFAGPISISELAEAEQVRVPSISRLVKDLEWEGLVERIEDPTDKRVQLIRATRKGNDLLQEGRQRRIEVLVAEIEKLTEPEKEAVVSGLEVLVPLFLPGDHPLRSK